MVYKGKGDNLTTTVGTDGVINKRFVVPDGSNGGVKLAGEDALDVIGIADGGKVNGHDGTASDPYLAGDVIAVAIEGVYEVELGGTVAEFGRVASDANGKAVAIGTIDSYDDLQKIVGYVLKAGDDGDVVPMKITKAL